MRRDEELEKEIKELDDKDLSISTHAFCLRAELVGRKEMEKEMKEKIKTAIDNIKELWE